MTRLFHYKLLGLNVFGIILAVTGVLAIGFWLYSEDKEANKTSITSKVIKGEKVLGEVVSGKNSSKAKNKLSTNTKVVYESKLVSTDNNSSTAAAISWSQQNESDGHTSLEMRVKDGASWSKWMYTDSDQGDRKDGTRPQGGGIILSKDINEVQYRLTLDKDSAEIDLSTIKIESIDTSKGPSVTNKTAWQKLGDFFGLNEDANARQKGPPIKSRAAWGSPEPYSSSRWTPQYEPIKRVIVHHTATTPTADSSAAVRAIWHYHANSRGWGDIGYNYLVDQSGNIFHGRYSNATYAEQNNVDVVGGHAYGNNLRTVGIAALGDFTNRSPSNSLIHSIGEVAAFKGGPYGFNAAKVSRGLVGHRDVLSTSCPGAKLYAKLGSIKSVVSALYPRYHVPNYAWKYVKQYVYSDPARENLIDPNTTPIGTGTKLYLTIQAKNVGALKWYPSGANPVRVGTSKPNGRTSTFCDPDSWINCSRPATISETSVAPGQVGNFNFSVVVPENTSLTSDVQLKEHFSLVAEGVKWFNDPGLFRSFTVPRQYKWKYVSQQSHTDVARENPIDLRTTPVSEGQRVYISMQARNTGSKAWALGDPYPIRLGTSRPLARLSAFCDSGSWINCARPVTHTEANVAVGDIGTFDFSIVAPANNTASEQAYNEYFNLVSENQIWLSDPGLYWAIRVSP